jgi:hypothetical protein
MHANLPEKFPFSGMTRTTDKLGLHRSSLHSATLDGNATWQAPPFFNICDQLKEDNVDKKKSNGVAENLRREMR